MSHWRIGIDLGGTKISGILLSPNGDAVVQHLRIPTPRDDYQATIHAISDLVDQLRGEAGGTPTIGIGTPGSTDFQTGTIQNANSVWLNDRPLHRDLQDALGQDIRMQNDANCLALSESVDGAGVGARTSFAVILGTGCGGGITIDGRLLEGKRHIAGEWGHTPLPWPAPDEVPGPTCWCGQTGCLETWISGPALLKHATATCPTIAQHNPQSVEELLDLRDDSKPALDLHKSRLARGLAMITNILDPDRIILAGGLSKLPHLLEGLPNAMAPFIFANDRKVDVRLAHHGDDSGVRGAARLWPIATG